MPAEVLGPWLASSHDEYLRERIAAGDSPEYAQQRADEADAEYFPDGRPAEGQQVYQVVDGDDVVGVLWIGPVSLQRPHEWWVFDIAIHEPHRGKGLGRATMLLAESEARRLGAVKLGLNVFGHNRVAQNLYTSLGYEPTAINMAKTL